MKKKLVLCLAILAAMLSACQPTPEKTITEYARPEAAPVSYRKQLSLHDGIELDVEASVSVPEGPLASAYLERRDVDESFVDSIARAISVSNDYYLGYETVSELTMHMMIYTSQLENARKLLSESDIAAIERTIENMNTALATAPETEPVITIEDVMKNGGGRLDTGGNIKASLVVANDGTRDFVRISCHRFKDIMTQTLSPLKLTEIDALKQAELLLDKLGIADEFSHVATTYGSNGYTQVVLALEQTGVAAYQHGEYMTLFFMRDINNQKQLFSEQLYEGATSNEYNSAVFWEMIAISYDDDGLLSFIWQEPCEVHLVSNNNAVIDIDTAVNAMCEHLSASYNRYTYDAISLSSEDIMVHIDRIECGMTCIIAENNTRLVIPTWEFYGNIEHADAKGNVSYIRLDGRFAGQTSDEPLQYYSLCSINALDGKVINRSRGY